MRILDLDLDFFLDGVAHDLPYDAPRLDPIDYPPWERDAAIAFLEQNCMLTSKLPGFVVERHGQLFPRWRDAIEEGKLVLPFEVTHVDAHADLGLGDHGYVYFMTELLFAPVEERRFPMIGEGGMDDGNWLNFAIACRWLSDLLYVFNRETDTPGDLLGYVLEGFDGDAEHIQLAALNDTEIKKLWFRPEKWPVPQRLEPKVPFKALPWKSFQASEPYDVVCLARSPAFTPVESDVLFDEIRARYIDETAFPRVADSARPSRAW